MTSLITINGVNVEVAVRGSLSRHDKKYANRELLSVFRATVCAHQGFIAQHFLLGNEYHKRLRIAFAGGEKQRTREIAQNLDRLHLNALREAWQVSVQHLTAYFALTHKSPVTPRLCIKGSVSSSTQPGSKDIVDILREDGSRSPISTPMSRNTGFQSVASNGKHYFENDIPEAVKLRGYVNPRLGPRQAAEYKIAGRFSAKRYLSTDPDRAWIGCWDIGGPAPSNPRTCYKSTLIIPMTLVNNPLSEEFLQDTPIGQDTKSDRSIYGFLCLDHQSRDYFHETDVNVGYIFADLLSMYRITSDALLTRSATYEGAKNLEKDIHV